MSKWESQPFPHCGAKVTDICVFPAIAANSRSGHKARRTLVEAAAKAKKNQEPPWEVVPCTRCKAAEGEVCKNPNGSPYKYVHIPRRSAFIALKARKGVNSND